MSLKETMASVESMRYRLRLRRGGMPTVDLCRRRFQRRAAQIAVELELGTPGGQTIPAFGMLVDLSLNGARIAWVRLADGRVWTPTDERCACVRIVDGPAAGFEAQGDIVRIIRGDTGFGLRFDSLVLRQESASEARLQT